MGFEFNADEMFIIAEQIERNGAKFYRSAAENVKEDDKKRLLLHLAEMEDEHEQTFKKLHSELTQEEKVLTTFDPNNEDVVYLKSLADTRVFYEKTIDFSDMHQILKEAILTEKDSIAFYLGMKELVPKHLGQERLEEIIKEEMSHIKILNKELLELD